MTTYSVTRQRVNMGRTQTLFTTSRTDAVTAFDIAVSEDDLFVTLFNETDDYEELRHLTPETVHHRY